MENQNLHTGPTQIIARLYMIYDNNCHISCDEKILLETKQILLFFSSNPNFGWIRIYQFHPQDAGLNVLFLLNPIIQNFYKYCSFFNQTS